MSQRWEEQPTRISQTVFAATVRGYRLLCGRSKGPKVVDDDRFVDLAIETITERQLDSVRLGFVENPARYPLGRIDNLDGAIRIVAFVPLSDFDIYHRILQTESNLLFFAAFSNKADGSFGRMRWFHLLTGDDETKDALMPTDKTTKPSDKKQISVRKRSRRHG